MTTNQDKKIEPFYCKPASYKEAVEICERTIANGVSKAGYPLGKWAYYEYWGVDNYMQTFGRSSAPTIELPLLTIQQVRERYPHPKYDTKEDSTIYVTENKQEFVLQAGKECFVVWFDRKNEKITPLYVGKESIVFTDDLGNERCEYLANIIDFYPLKTEAEIRREKSVDEMVKDCFYSASSSTRIDCEALYDAGYIKPREITDDDIIRTLGITSSYDHDNFTSAVRWAEKHIKGGA